MMKKEICKPSTKPEPRPQKTFTGLTVYGLFGFESEKGSKFGNFRTNLVAFRVLKGNLLVGVPIKSSTVN